MAAAQRGVNRAAPRRGCQYRGHPASWFQCGRHPKWHPANCNPLGRSTRRSTPSGRCAWSGTPRCTGWPRTPSSKAGRTNRTHARAPHATLACATMMPRRAALAGTPSSKVGRARTSSKQCAHAHTSPRAPRASSGCNDDAAPRCTFGMKVGRACTVAHCPAHARTPLRPHTTLT